VTTNKPVNEMTCETAALLGRTNRIAVNIMVGGQEYTWAEYFNDDKVDLTIKDLGEAIKRLMHDR